MKISRLLFSVLLITGLNSAAQFELPRSKNVAVTKSAPYQVVDANSKQYFSFGPEDVLAVKILGKKYDSFLFQKFEGDRLTLKGTEAGKIDVKGYEYWGIRKMKNKLFLFYYVSPEKDRYDFYAREINADKGGFVGSAKLLFSETNGVTNPPWAWRYLSYGGFFSIDFSEDENYFVIKYTLKPKIKRDSKNKAEVAMHVFNNDLEKVWNNIYTMPYTENMMHNMDFTVDSEGLGYFLIKKYKLEPTSKDIKNDPSNETFAILYTNGKDPIEEFTFKMRDNFIDNVILKENAKGDIVCAGYYKKPKSESVDGIFITSLQSNGQFNEPKFFEFSPEFIKEYTEPSKKQEKRMAKAEEEGTLGLANLEMRTLNSMADGSLLLTGEVFKVVTYTDSKGNTRTTYYYLDIVVAKITADGELLWLERIPKLSITESYKVFLSKGFTYLMFTDNPKNAELKKDQKPNASRGDDRQVIVYRFDNKTGERQYMPMFGFKEIDGTPVYQYGLNRVTGLTETSFAVEMYIKDKKDMMFKIEFTE